MTDKELMQQALDDICAAKLCEFNSMSSRHEMIRLMDKAIAALRERLAQPWEKFCDTHCTAFDHHPDCKLEQPVQEHIIDCPRCGHCCPQQPVREPVAWVTGWHDGHCVVRAVNPALMLPIGAALYTAPQPRQWQGLTDEAIWLEYQRFWPFHPADEPKLAQDIAKFARAIEAKLKEKNT